MSVQFSQCADRVSCALADGHNAQLAVSLQRAVCRLWYIHISVGLRYNTMSFGSSPSSHVHVDIESPHVDGGGMERASDVYLSESYLLPEVTSGFIPVATCTL